MSVPDGAVTYADGSEDYLVEVMRAVADRSAASDELAAHVRDWPSRYHLSRMRANLLRPLNLRGGMRVLDIGAGTGALARYLGEVGCEVVALEGNPDRARAAALRCDGLDNVSVVNESLGAYADPDGFDLVLVCGVLEYAADALGGGGGAESFLDQVRSVTRPAGAVAVAIENKLGLKYLLGYAEDHLGRPWIGVEGYPTTSAVRTYPRTVLGGMLGRAGFEHQGWLYPFPDYKLPKVVLAEGAYAQADSVDFVDQLVGKPCRDLANPQALMCDERRAHRSFLEAGLGPDVANSFFVSASSDPAGVERLVPGDVLAWHFGQERRRHWLRGKVVHQGEGADDRRVTARPLTPDYPALERERDEAAGWLSQSVNGEGPYVVGLTLEQAVLEACAQADSHAVSMLVRSWWDHLGALVTLRSGGPRTNPFQMPGTEAVLPDGYVDVNLGNFVLTADGFAYVDAEWAVEGGADPALVALRALWYLAHDLVTGGSVHPWPDTLSVDGLALELARAGGVPATEERLEWWRQAEAEFQAVVTDVEPEADLAARKEIGARSGESIENRRGLPFSRLIDPGWPLDVEDLRHELQSLRREFDRQRDELRRHSDSLMEAKATIEDLQGDRDRLHRITREMSGDLERQRAETAAAHEEIARWQARWQALERRWPIRLVRLLARRPSGGQG